MSGYPGFGPMAVPGGGAADGGLNAAYAVWAAAYGQPTAAYGGMPGAAYGQQGFAGQCAYGGGKGSDQGYGYAYGYGKGAAKGGRGFGKGKGKGKGRFGGKGFGGTPAGPRADGEEANIDGEKEGAAEGGAVAEEDGETGAQQGGRERDPRWQIEMAQRKAKTRDRSAISQAQRCAQLRFEKDVLDRVQGKWVDASDESITYTVEGSLCSVAAEEGEARVFRNRLSVYNGELCWDARRFWHYLDLAKLYAAADKPESVEWNPGEGTPPTKQIIWNRAPPEPEVPADLVRKGMAAFQEKYNANDMEFCGSCYTDSCYVTVNGGKKAGGFGPFTTPEEVTTFLTSLRNDMGATEIDFMVTEVTGSRHKDTWTSSTFTGACDAFWVEVEDAPLGWKIKRDKITATPKQQAAADGEEAAQAASTAEAVAEAAVA